MFLDNLFLTNKWGKKEIFASLWPKRLQFWIKLMLAHLVVKLVVFVSALPQTVINIKNSKDSILKFWSENRNSDLRHLKDRDIGHH